MQEARKKYVDTVSLRDNGERIAIEMGWTFIDDNSGGLRISAPNIHRREP